MQDTVLITDAQAIINLCAQVLARAPLTDEQRQDITEVQQAATRFRELALAEHELLRERRDSAALQRVRHDLRNHVNIILGYTRIIVRDLPDNLLLHMVSVRNIHATAIGLLEHVDALQHKD